MPQIRSAAALLLLVLALTCGAVAAETFRSAAWSVAVPAGWTVAPADADDPASIGRLLGGSGGEVQAMLTAYAATLPRTVAAAVVGYYANATASGLNSTVVASGSEQLADRFYANVTLQSDGTEYTAYYRWGWCNNATYGVGFLAASSAWAAQAATRDALFASIACEPFAAPAPALSSGQLGIYGNPARTDGATMADLVAAQQQAVVGGAGMAHTYLDWGSVQNTSTAPYVWDVPDMLLDLPRVFGQDVSLVLSLISTNQRGTLPDDLQERAWDDAELLDALAAFLQALLDRYMPPGAGASTRLWLEMGNEINVYFATAPPDEWPAYKRLLQAAMAAVQGRGVPLGTVTAFHEAWHANNYSLLHEAAALTDFNAYTLYPMYANLSYTLPVAIIDDLFAGMLGNASGKPIAVTELGWVSTAQLGTTAAVQAAAVSQAFASLLPRRDSIHFLVWFEMYDLTHDYAVQVAEFFFPDPASRPTGQIWDDFVAYLQYLGLREQGDASQKPAWAAWLAGAADYFSKATGGGGGGGGGTTSGGGDGGSGNGGAAMAASSTALAAVAGLLFL